MKMKENKKRGSGILLHITSLPSKYGIGDLGASSYEFADFLSETKQSYWQVLPLNPTDQATCNSPYNSVSAFAGNTLLISPEFLMKEGFLSQEHISTPNFPEGFCDYTRVIPFKEKLFEVAYQNFSRTKHKSEFEEFCSTNWYWLDDYSLFLVIKEICGGKIWSDWTEGLKLRDENSIKEIRKRYYKQIEKHQFLQFIFFKQLYALKNYCNSKKIKIIGDIPIYVRYDSADVWSNKEIFKLDDNFRPLFVAGVPPDYFSKTGQLWGNPVYNWDILKKRDFDWFLKRLDFNLNLFDIVRIDHFRGLVAYWEIPATSTTAENGKWVKAFPYELFNKLPERLKSNIIAEDLGTITEDVTEVLTHFGIPGMKVLLFAFDDDNPKHPYLPHNYNTNCVVYTGTHDNNTAKGWFDKEAGTEAKERLFKYIGRKVGSEDINWELIRLAMMSVADIVIIPIQDVLGLGEEGRMNLPSTSSGNWRWRLLPGSITPQMKQKLLELTKIYGRD